MDKALVKITIPDNLSKEQQLKALKDWLELVRMMEKITGQEGSSDMREIEKKIAELEGEQTTATPLS